MTREELIETIEGFESFPFGITFNGEYLAPMTFVKAMSDSVKVMFKGKPATYKYALIDSLSFENGDLDEHTPDLSASTDAPLRSNKRDWQADYQIALHEISYVNLMISGSLEQLRSRIKGSSIYGDWNRIVDMFNSAKKNHALEQKKDRILDELKSLPDCSETRLSLGYVYAESNMYKDAADCFFAGGDYHNAAVCALIAKDEETALQYLQALVESHRIDNINCIRNYFYLLCKHNRSIAALKITLANSPSIQSDECINIIYYGFLLVIHRYDPDFTCLNKVNGTKSEIIPILYKKLESFTANENEMQLTHFPNSNEKGTTVYHAKLYEYLSSLTEMINGELTSYDNSTQETNHCGTIYCERKCYFIRNNTIIDPVLRICLNKSPNHPNIHVRFVGKELDKYREAVLILIDGIKESVLIAEYQSYVNQSEYGDFLQAVNDLKNNQFAPRSINPLQSISYLELPVPSSLPQVKPPSSSVSKPFKFGSSGFDRLGIVELLNKGNRYLTQSKNHAEAEKCFLEVLKRDPNPQQINTAVSNLVMIYKQTGRLDDAIHILEKYKTSMDKDKYNNHLIDILDKNKNYTAMIELLNQMIPNAGKSRPHRIKQLIMCYLKLEDERSAAEALRKYKKDLDEISYNTLYISMLEIRDIFDQIERFLIDIISKTYRAERKLNYMNRLAILYQKNSLPEKAIEINEQWKKYYTSNRSSITMSTAVTAISKMDVAVDRNLCILYYQSGRTVEAKQLAKTLLRKNSEDIIAQQIINDTYVADLSETSQMLDNNSDIDFEDVDASIPKLVEWMLNDVDFEREFYSLSILNHIDENQHYIGDEAQAKKEIESIHRLLPQKPLSERSRILMALAKVCKQLYEKHTAIGQTGGYFTQTRLNLLYGKSLMYKADTDVQKGYQNKDSSRYYYFLSLRYLSRSGSEDFNHAINILYKSFFLSDNELANAVSQNNADISIIPPSYQESVLAINELMTYSFELDNTYYASKIGDDRIIRQMIDAIYYKSAELRCSLMKSMKILLINSDIICKNADEYYAVWKKAKECYLRKLGDLKKELKKIPSIINSPEQLKTLIRKIHEMNESQILCKTDVDYFRNTIEILSRFHGFNELAVIEDREEALDRALESCESLEKQIRETPTALSYEVMLDIIVTLKGKAQEFKNKLYSESKPNLNVYPDTTAYYQDGQYRTVVTIYIENRGNVQKADLSNINIRGKDNQIFIAGNPEHTVTTVHGKEKEEYTVEVSFTDAEIEKKLFDISFSFDYSYYDGNGEQIKSHFDEVFQINLSNMDTFAMIDNKFSSFTSGGAVESDEMFFGREQEIENIVSSLDIGNGKVLSHRGIYMYGQKRAGKSSIMAHLAQRINEVYPNKYIIIDLGSLGSNSSNDTWLKANLIIQLGDELEENYPEVFEKIDNAIPFIETFNRISNNSKAPEFDAILKKFEKLLPDKVLMIFIDEFTYIYDSIKRKECDDSFPHFWKALLQNYNISSIIIGQDSMKNFAEEYANDFACMEGKFVSYLDEAGAKRMISDPIKDNGKSRFDEEALELIYQLTAGSAYLIMIFCSQLVDYMNKRGSSRVTKITVETFVKKWLFNTTENDNALSDFHFDAQLNDPCFFESSDQISADNKKLLTYIATHCNLNNQIKKSEINCIDQLSKHDFNYQNDLLTQLIKRKVLIQDGEYCQIWVDLLRIYLKGGM